MINKFYLLCVIFSGSPDLTLKTCLVFNSFLIFPFLIFFFTLPPNLVYFHRLFLLHQFFPRIVPVQHHCFFTTVCKCTFSPTNSSSKPVFKTAVLKNVNFIYKILVVSTIFNPHDRIACRFAICSATPCCQLIKQPSHTLTRYDAIIPHAFNVPTNLPFF